MTAGRIESCRDVRERGVAAWCSAVGLALSLGCVPRVILRITLVLKAESRVR